MNHWSTLSIRWEKSGTNIGQSVRYKSKLRVVRRIYILRAPKPAVVKGTDIMAARKKNEKLKDSPKRASKPEPITLPSNYRPSEGENFMNPLQREYFRQKLIGWRDEILAESSQTIMHLREETNQQPDSADRASIESGRLIELRSRDRERKLLAKIDAALQRILDGSYGYCEETGDPISLSRLEARPVATLTIDAQERHERMEKTFTDD